MAVTDNRREDLVVPYKHHPQKVKSPANMLSSSLPMAAMFMRNKLMAWTALFSAIQAWLSEPKVRTSDQQPAWLTLVTACVGLVTCYSDFVLPRKSFQPIKEAASSISSTIISPTGK